MMNRGDHREDIFRDDNDRYWFVHTLGEACARTDWQVHAWCLMRNHFHLVVETPKPNLVDGMKWLLGTYTSRFNRRHRLCGHLFSGRYKALFIDGSGNGYLKTVCDYVHLNPARAKILSNEQKLSVFGWSSYPAYLKPPSSRPIWLRVDRLLGEHGIYTDTATGRAELERRMELRRASEEEDFKPIAHRWCLGSEAFRKELLERMGEKKGVEHFGPEIQESAQEKADRIIEEELRRIGWSEAELSERRKGDVAKVGIALRLRRETTMTTAWIDPATKDGNSNPFISFTLPARTRQKFTILRTDP